MVLNYTLKLLHIYTHIYADTYAHTNTNIQLQIYMCMCEETKPLMVVL